jgi:hypothetical protein
VKGKTVGIDATTLDANTTMRSIPRRGRGESYEEFLKGLAKESGIETPTREDLARFDRTRKNKSSDKDCVNPYDRDARITCPATLRPGAPPILSFPAANWTQSQMHEGTGQLKSP